MILFLPTLYGILNAILWLLSFFRFFGPWIMTFCTRLVPFFSGAWTVLNGIGKFLFSWKGVLVYLGSWIIANLFGLGGKFAEFHVFLAGEIGKVLYVFFFDENGGLAWEICLGLIWLGGIVVSGLEGFGFIQASFGAYSDSVSFAMRLAGRLNQFFPIVEAGVLLELFLTFVLFFLMFKGIAKLIPTIG